MLILEKVKNLVQTIFGKVNYILLYFCNSYSFSFLNNDLIASHVEGESAIHSTVECVDVYSKMRAARTYFMRPNVI